MSRSRKDRPERVWENSSAAFEKHDHRNGICDITGRPAEHISSERQKTAGFATSCDLRLPHRIWRKTRYNSAFHAAEKAASKAARKREHDLLKPESEFNSDTFEKRLSAGARRNNRERW
jgi:hypothetical protein